MSSRKIHVIEKASDFGNTVAQIRIEDILDIYALNKFIVMKIQTTVWLVQFLGIHWKYMQDRDTKQ